MTRRMPYRQGGDGRARCLSCRSDADSPPGRPGRCSGEVRPGAADRCPGRLSGLPENDVDERLYGSGFVDAADEGAFDEAEVRAGIVQRLSLDAASAELDAAWM